MHGMHVVVLSCGAATLSVLDLTPLQDRHPETPLSPFPQSAPRRGAYHAVFFMCGCRSEQAARSHRDRLIAADHQVIEHPHADQPQRVAQFVGDRAVGVRVLDHLVIGSDEPVSMAARGLL